MTDALADLFSATSPTRAPRRTPSLPASPESTSVEALFLSPGQTPDRAARRPKPTRPRAPSPRIAARRSKSPSLPPLILDDPVAVLAPEFDPLVAPIGGSGGDDDLPVKKRRVMAKIDEERLTSENGFPALMRAAKKFKPRGKGREVEDLKDLLQVYQLWAHVMFPKGDFVGTINRIETVCHKRRMEMSIKGYREAFYPPPPRSPSPPGLSPLSSQPLPAMFSSDRARERLHEDQEDDETEERVARRLFDPPPEDPDMDEIMATEEMERVAQKDDRPGNDSEEDEWEGLYD